MSLNPYLFDLPTRRVVDENGVFTLEAQQWFDDFIRASNVNADAANEGITEASETSSQAIVVPPSFVWNSDTAGVFPAGNPTRDIDVTFIDINGVELAKVVVRGQLDTFSGNITASLVSTTGEPVTFLVRDQGTMSVAAEITLNSTGAKGLANWSSVDITVAGGTPVSGGGK